MLQATVKPLIIAKVLDVICDLAGIEADEVDARQSFFAMGIDSLMLTQIAVLLTREFQIKVTFRDLLETYPNLDQLASHLARSPMVAAWPTTSGGLPVPSQAPLAEADASAAAAGSLPLPPGALTAAAYAATSVPQSVPPGALTAAAYAAASVPQPVPPGALTAAAYAAASVPQPVPPGTPAFGANATASGRQPVPPEAPTYAAYAAAPVQLPPGAGDLAFGHLAAVMTQHMQIMQTYLALFQAREQSGHSARFQSQPQAEEVATPLHLAATNHSREESAAPEGPVRSGRGPDGKRAWFVPDARNPGRFVPHSGKDSPSNRA